MDGNGGERGVRGWWGYERGEGQTEWWQGKGWGGRYVEGREESGESGESGKALVKVVGEQEGAIGWEMGRM